MSPATGPDLQVVQDVLTETLREFPYNSAVQFHQFIGLTEQGPEWGGACPWQAAHAGDRIAELTGHEARYVVDGRHVAALFVSDEDVTVVDPYLMHRTAFRLDRRDPSRARQSVDAFPLRRRADGTPAPGRTRAEWDEQTQTLHIEYTRFSPTRGHNVMSRAFALRLDSQLPGFPPERELILPLLTHPEQNNLSIRAVLTDSDEMGEVALPLADRRLIARDNQGAVHHEGSTEFDRIVERVAAAVDHKPTEVVEHLLEAAELYDSVAPPGQELPAYHAGDE